MRRITRCEMWLATAVYRWTRLVSSSRRLRYRRFGGRCYECFRGYGSHKLGCSVGRREFLR